MSFKILSLIELCLVFLFMTVSDLSFSHGVLAQVAREWTHQLQTFSTANWSTIAVATPCWDACQSFLKLSTIHCGQSRRKISYSFQMPAVVCSKPAWTGEDWLLLATFEMSEVGGDVIIFSCISKLIYLLKLFSWSFWKEKTGLKLKVQVVGCYILILCITRFWLKILILS